MIGRVLDVLCFAGIALLGLVVLAFPVWFVAVILHIWGTMH